MTVACTVVEVVEFTPVFDMYCTYVQEPFFQTHRDRQFYLQAYDSMIAGNPGFISASLFGYEDERAGYIMKGLDWPFERVKES